MSHSLSMTLFVLLGHVCWILRTFSPFSDTCIMFIHFFNVFIKTDVSANYVLKNKYQHLSFRRSQLSIIFGNES